MDISTLSKQLNMSVAQLRFKMNQAGFRVSPKANKIDNLMAKQVLNALAMKKVENTTASGTPKEVKLPGVMSVKELAQILGLDVTVVIKKLIQNGVLASINEEVDFDTAAIVASDLGFNVSEVKQATTRLGLGFVSDSIADEVKEKPGEFITRPPIVAVMGHVDHGKTTLLDNIRKTKVVDTEAGRITQHIGAYQVHHKEKQITFLDTPGHEAFSAMRARGANVTDIIVLVVAADDGVKPQTIEVINRAKLTQTPLLVAVNKVDKPDANIDRVKKELSDYGVLIEEWGGTTPIAKISGLTGSGVDELLDLILLQAEVMDLKANPNGQVLGTVIESHLSRTKGSVATVIVQNGTLKLGDVVAMGKAYGKVRSMEEATGRKVKTAGPAAPVLLTGISEAPQVGDILKVYPTIEEARDQALEVVKSERAKKFQSSSRLNVTGKELNLIIKADVLGSLEAIAGALEKLKNNEVKLNILEQGVGEVNENDILRAQSSNGIIIGFHTRLNAQAAKLAQAKKVPVQLYDIIYELVEDLTRQVIDMLTPEVMRTDLGRAKILAVFRTEKDKMIVGGTVAEGKIKDKAFVEIKRGEQIVGRGQITELQQSKVKSNEVLRGTEFGVSVKTTTNILEGDILIVYEEFVRKRNLEG